MTMIMSPRQLELAAFGLMLFKPKPILSGSEWADEYFYLSPESSARPGKWKTDPWQKEILDEMTNTTTPFVSVEKSARVGYTKMLNITQGYFIHQDPCSILHAQPTDGDIIGYAEDEFEPMIRDNDVIRERVNTHNNRGRNKREKTVKKMYPGGIWEGIGAHSPRNFRRRTNRVTMGDEIDGWEFEAGKEGDPVSLFQKRSQGFWNRKNILGGTPTLLKISKIHKSVNSGDGRRRFLPCPHCGHEQMIEFENFRYQINDNGMLIKESVVLECVACLEPIEENQKLSMDEKGEWRAERPFNGHASFHIWSAYAHDPNYRWHHIVQEYLDSKDDELKLKVFTNTVLGKPWEDKIEKNQPEDILSLKIDLEEGKIPTKTAAVVMAVDVQKDHFWFKIVAFMYGNGSHLVRYGRAETWADVELIMRTPYYDVSGVGHMVRICAVDSGYLADEVYEFCAMNSDVCIPVKGASQRMSTPYTVSNIDKDINGRPVATGLKLYKLDTEYYKDILDAKIKRSIAAVANGETAQNNLMTLHSGTDDLYVKQMTSEYKHVESNPKTGVEKSEWRKVTEKADNHLWDDGTYTTFLGELLGIRFLPSEPIETVSRQQRRERPAPRHDDDESNY